MYSNKKYSAAPILNLEHNNDCKYEDNFNESKCNKLMAQYKTICPKNPNKKLFIQNRLIKLAPPRNKCQRVNLLRV